MNLSPAIDALNNEVAGRSLFLFGHGTTAMTVADEILNNGLGTDEDHVLHTSDPLSLDPDELGEILRAPWRVDGRPIVVIIGVEAPSALASRAILQVTPPDHVFIGGSDRTFANYIPARFVLGFYDRRIDLFVSNSRFNPKFDPALEKTSADPTFHEGGSIERFAGGNNGPVEIPQSATGDGIETW